MTIITNRPVPVPARQARWTRLGITLGHTNSAAKRTEIQSAVETMTWVEPNDLHHVLDTAPTRFVIASLFYGRPWALHRAAVTDLGEEDTGRSRRLIALESVNGERFLLLDVGYEVIDLLHETPTHTR